MLACRFNVIMECTPELEQSSQEASFFAVSLIKEQYDNKQNK